MKKKKKNKEPDLRYMSGEEKCEHYDYRDDVMCMEIVNRMNICIDGGHNRKPDAPTIPLSSRQSKGRKAK